MAKRRGMKSAYRMTNRRKAALRKAQLISARKRKKNGLKAVGILATGVGLGILGTKFGGSGVNMAKDLKNRGFRFNNPANTAKMTPEGLEANMKENAVSPASAARQAPPVKPPNMNNTKTSASDHGPGPEKTAKGNFGGAAVPGNTTTTVVPSEGRVTDSWGQAQVEKARDPNQRTIHPLAKGMTKDRIRDGLVKAGVKPEEATWREIRVLAEVQAEFINRNGVKLSFSPGGRASKEFNKYYRSLLDIWEVPSAGDIREARKKGIELRATQGKA